MGEEIGRVLYVVRTWVPGDQLEQWDDWHTKVHVPGVVAQPQVRRARKYRVADDNTPAEWAPQYVTVYEFDSWRDWESYNTGPEAARLRAEYAELYGATGKISRQVLVQVAEVAEVAEGEVS
jgi:hypothetical protein